MTERALAIDDLAKVFGGLAAVDGVSLTVAAGERRVLIGANGAGKTTLFHCITGADTNPDGTDAERLIHRACGPGSFWPFAFASRPSRGCGRLIAWGHPVCGRAGRIRHPT